MDERCPRCRREGDVFVNLEGWEVNECLWCRLVWARVADGGAEWFRVASQDEALEVQTDGALVVWEGE